MVSLIGMIAGVVSVGGAIYLFFVRISEHRSAPASGSWPSTPGQITASSIQKFGFWRTTFQPQVEYVFKANGQTGKRIACRMLATRDEQEAQAIGRKYPVGAKVKVTYNPGDPQD